MALCFRIATGAQSTLTIVSCKVNSLTRASIAALVSDIMIKGRVFRAIKFFAFPGLLLTFAGALLAGPLEDYVAKPDTNYSWRLVTNREVAGVTASQLKLTSQQWRESNW